MARAARRLLPLGDAARTASTPTAMVARAVEHGVIYVAGEAFFVDGVGQQPPAAVVLGADDPIASAKASGGWPPRCATSSRAAGHAAGR